MPICLIAIGANQGDRQATFDAVVEHLRERHRATGSEFAESRRIVTPSVGGPTGQGSFLNSVVRITTDDEPRTLLNELLALERSVAPREGPRWASRALDLDLIAVGDAVIDEPGLRLPHPRMSFRPFVVGPAAELAPDWEHPEIGATLAELQRTLASPDTRLVVHGQGRHADESSALAEAFARETQRSVEVGRADARLHGTPPGLTIDAAEASAACRGPRLRVADCDPGRLAEEIHAAIECVWPR